MKFILRYFLIFFLINTVNARTLNFRNSNHERIETSSIFKEVVQVAKEQLSEEYDGYKVRVLTYKTADKGLNAIKSVLRDICLNGLFLPSYNDSTIVKLECDEILYKKSLMPYTGELIFDSHWLTRISKGNKAFSEILKDAIRSLYDDEIITTNNYFSDGMGADETSFVIYSKKLNKIIYIGVSSHV